MAKSFLVLGLGRFGRAVAQTLSEAGHEVLGVDGDEKIIQSMSHSLTEVIQADLTSESFLSSLDVARFHGVVVAIGENMQVSIMATVILKELGARNILVKAQDDFQEKVLYRLGADKVVLPERDTGIKTGHMMAAENLFDMVEISESHAIIRMAVPASWAGKTVGELALRAKYGINVIALSRKEAASIIPTASTMLEAGAELTVIGESQDLKRLISVK